MFNIAMKADICKTQSFVQFEKSQKLKAVEQNRNFAFFDFALDPSFFEIFQNE